MTIRFFCFLAAISVWAQTPAAVPQRAAKPAVPAPNEAKKVAGKAKAEAALGDTSSAVRDYAATTAQLPLPQYVLEYGELLQSMGRAAQAQEQYRLLTAEQSLMAAGGVLDDLTASQVAADHGDPADAVRHAQAEWDRRHSVLVADALAWALHKDGRDTEALGFARQAGALGWHNATFEYHRGAIEDALGLKEQARADLAEALKTNAHFSPLQAGDARRELARLTGTGATP